ncbi:hypothetical protein AMECASPLE_009302 [Ameca splendens]|uniref:Secreted protein n=1 Tax=Ameca splendens TaxID=208324 RepID=A0ABV0YY77_9TELE
MGSVSECTMSIVVCLYVGCEGVSVLCVRTRVGMCDCVRLGIGWLPLLDQFRPPIKCGAYFLPSTLTAGGWCRSPPVYLWFSVSGRFGVCRLTPGGCLPWPGPLGSVGPLLGE